MSYLSGMKTEAQKYIEANALQARGGATKMDSGTMKLPIDFEPMPVGEVLKYLEELVNSRVLSDEWTYLIGRADRLLKEKTKDAVERATAGVQPMAYWVNPEGTGHCSNCGFDRPSFISGSNWETISTEYCPHCGAKMVEEKDGDGE